ncbi:MAG: hypothetical protein V4608_10865 [Bacteroidota bacterium]
MKTETETPLRELAKKILKDKLKNMNAINNSDYTYNKVIEAIEETALQFASQDKWISVDDCKWIVFYGHNKDKTVIVDEESKHLDYAITQMFIMMKESSRFHSESVEELFWKRIQALATLPPPPKTK